MQASTGISSVTSAIIAVSTTLSGFAAVADSTNHQIESGSNEDNGARIAIAVGATVGSLLFLLAVACFGCCYNKRKGESRNNNEEAGYNMRNICASRVVPANQNSVGAPDEDIEFRSPAHLPKSSASGVHVRSSSFAEDINSSPVSVRVRR